MLKERSEVSDKSLESTKARLIAVLDKNPAHIDSILSLANIFEQEGNWQEVLFWLTKGLKVDPHNIIFGLRKAMVLLDELEDVDSAFYLLKDLTAQFNFLTVEEIKQEWDDELVLEILFMLIDCYRIKKDFLSALEFAQKAKSICPQNEKAILALATAHFDVGEYKKSIFLLEPIIVQNNSADFIWQKAQVHCANGEFEMADMAFKTAHQLEPAIHHIPLRLTQKAFKELLETSLLSESKEVQNYLANIKIEIMDIVPLDWVQKSVNRLSPLELSTCEENPSIIILFQKNIENLSSDKEEMKNIISSVILHELQTISQTML